MSQYIEWILVTIIVAALAGLLSIHALGKVVLLGPSEVAAHEDNGHHDDHDDSGNVEDSGQSTDVDSSNDGSEDGHTDIGDGFDHDVASGTAIDQHIDDAREFIGGTEVFIGNNSQLNAGGMAADADAGLFFDPATGQAI